MTIYNHTATDRTPYTYLIISKTTGMAYYGVRFGKNCHPSDLFVKYFTSSNEIKREIKLFGVEGFMIEIRKTFESMESAVIWEQTVNRRLTYYSKKFYNKDFGLLPHLTIQTRTKVIKISNKELGLCVSHDMTAPIPDGWELGNINRAGKGNGCAIWCYDPISLKHTMVIDETDIPNGWIRGRVGHSNSETMKEKKYFWITNDIESTQISFYEDIPFGWKRGRVYKVKPSGKRRHPHIWITNGIESTQIPNIQTIPEGWRNGRTKTW